MSARDICYVLLLFTLPPFVAAAERQNINDLQKGVEQFLSAHYPLGEQRHSVKIAVNKFNQHLHLSKCDKPLTHKLLNPRQQGGQITVQTICDGAKPWSIYVPAKVDILQLVAVAKQDLLRGTQLTENQLELQPRTISAHTQAYASNISMLIGKQLKQTLRKGDTIRLRSLINPTVIKRGDFVSVEASSGVIHVVTRGTALSAGRVGEQIKIKNNTTNRVIKAKIIASGTVAVIL